MLSQQFPLSHTSNAQQWLVLPQHSAAVLPRFGLPSSHRSKSNVACKSRNVACKARNDDRSSKDWDNSTSSVIHPTSLLAFDYATRTATAATAAAHPQEETPTPAPAATAAPATATAAVAKPVELTVYSIRLTTSASRGAALSSLFSAVNVCLVCEDGRSILHRVSPLKDPSENAKMIEDICSIVGTRDDGIGANCLVINAMRLATPAKDADPTSPEGKAASDCKLRFQEGCVDEVCFLAPELGPLAGILVGTESGSWLLDEVQVSSSRTNHTDRFVCRRKLGSTQGEGASWLTPIPEGAVVYGSGDNSIILTKEQARSLHSIDMSDYVSLKQRLLLTSFVLTAGGSGLAGMLGGIPFALPFAAGGLIGCMYQWMLQQGVDGLVLASSSSEYAPGSTAKRVVGSPAVRLGLVAASAYAAMNLAMQNEAEKAACSSAACAASVAAAAPPGIWQFVIGMLGFMTYKLALVGVAMAPQSSSMSMSDKLKTKENHMEAL